MGNILSIIGAVLVLSFLVIIHELGHYWAAKRNGIKVPEFGIGFPPKLFKFKRNGTEFSVNLIPFGGYVKLHGEDSHDPKVLKDKSSFASKTPWQKIQVILAGVLMNFLVFWVLQSFALWSGVAPVMTTQDDFKQAVNEGYYNLKPDLIVESSEDDRFKQGDIITKINESENFDLETAVSFVKGDIEDLKSIEIKSGKELKTVLVDGSNPDMDFYPLTMVPSFDIVNVSDDSRFAEVLLPGDKLLSVNGFSMFDVDAFWKGINSPVDGKTSLKVERDKELLDLSLPAVPGSLYVESVIADSPAAIGGMKAGDMIFAVDGLIVEFGDDIAKQVKDKGVEKVVYTVRRGEEDKDLLLSPSKDGLIGVYLTTEVDLSDLGIKFIPTSHFGSLIKVKDFSVPLYKAPLVALSEGYKIGKATVAGFGKTVYGLVSSFKVSDEVGGPVEVARLSYQFVEKGGVDLINFIALLSLSLAVINLLPIPALDGGRFVFIIIEALRGKPVNQKVEGIIHTVGFMLLMALIVVISFFDIIRL